MILYKKDTKGKIRFLKIWADSGNLYQESGVLNGKSVIHTKVCNAKNIGKSNETTPEEQAKSESESNNSLELASVGISYSIWCQIGPVSIPASI